MIRIGAAIAITEESAFDESVVVGALPVLDRRGCGDGEGQLGQDGWFEDPLRTDQGDSGALEVEAAFEDRAREGGFAEAASRSSVMVQSIAEAKCERVSASGTQR